MSDEKKPARPTIQELEAILDDDEECSFEILPNGEVRRRGAAAAEGLDKKPLTFREQLGGEYRQSFCAKPANQRRLTSA